MLRAVCALHTIDAGGAQAARSKLRLCDSEISGMCLAKDSQGTKEKPV